MKIAWLSLITLITACSHTPIKTEKPLAQYWISPVANDRWELRTFSAATCPTLKVNGQERALENRFVTDEKFPRAVCQIQIARATKVTTLAETTLNPNPKRFVIFGDTGCRIKVKGAEASIQGCNDPNDWPFAKVAASAARWKPDLVIHVGDYHYRDADCPAGHSECEGSVTGDRHESWMQDFFTPAEPLLKAAPWIFVRGNHEICERAGNGWFHYLAPGAMPKACTNTTQSYSVSYPGRDYMIVDSADDKNTQGNLDHPPQLRKNSWLLTHRPLLTLDADESTPTKIKFPEKLMRELSAVLVGHVHTVSLDRFRDGRPPEMILGNGGDLLASKGPTEAQAKAADLATTFHEYGFTTFEDLGANKWKVIVHDRDGKDRISCDWSENVRDPKGLNCRL